MGDLQSELLRKLGISPSAEPARSALARRFTAEARRARTKHERSARLYPGGEFVEAGELISILESVPEPPSTPLVEGDFDPDVFTARSTQVIRGDHSGDSLRMRAEGSDLIVMGNLFLNASLKQDFRGGALLVLGSLHAKSIVSTGEIDVVGDVEVADVLFGNCTNYGTNVWGRADVRVLVSAKGHHFSFWGGAQCEVIVDVEGATPNLKGCTFDGESMHQLLHGSFDGHDEDHAYELIRRGIFFE
ncbi:MAG: hypothetical protein AB8H86_29735 [Polyangiales bacterium]